VEEEEEEEEEEIVPFSTRAATDCRRMMMPVE
jgi:hypothetical protein